MNQRFTRVALLLVPLVVFSVSADALAQVGGLGEQNFTGLYGGDIGLNDVAWKITPMSDGGFAVMVNSGTSSTSGGTCLVLRLDNSFQVIWQKRVSELGGQQNCQSPLETPDGGLFVGFHRQNTTWVAKLSAAGEIENMQRIGFAHTLQLTQAQDGALLLLGHDRDAPGGLAPAIIERPTESQPRVHSYGGRANEVRLTRTPDGGYAMAVQGLVEGSSPSVYRVLKLDGGFNVQWDKIYRHTNSAWPSSILATSDGGLLVSGDAPGGRAFFMKLALDGQVIWQESIAASIVDPFGSYPIQVIETSDGGYVAAGVLNIDQASWMVKLDVDGNPLWSTRFGNNNHLDQALSLLEDVDGSLVAAGVTRLPGSGQVGKVMVTRVNADGSQPGDCFLLFGYTNAIVTVTDVQVSDFPSAPRLSNLTVVNDPYRGEDTNLSSRLCSTPAPR